MAKKGQFSRAAVWVILGLLFVGLVGFGAADFGGSIRVVATVEDSEVTVDDYARELQQEIRAIAAETGRALSMSEVQAFGVDRTVLSRLVSRAALQSETMRLGLSVGDANVGQQITQLPAFRGVDGSFDRDGYAFALESQGLSVAEFENDVRGQMARNILTAGVVGGFEVQDTYVDTLYAWVREERDITWALLGADDLTDPLPEPSQGDLSAHHAANAERYTLSETRAITYAWLTPDMLLDTIEPDEESLKSLYQQRIDEFVQPERRLVERLVFGSEDEAAEALARIEAGETRFEELVAERGLDLGDVDLGDVTRADLDAAGNGVFAPADLGVTGPHPTALGPALFRINAILSATETTYEEAREELVSEMAADRARRMIDDMIGDLDDLLAGGATLEEIADETGMELGTIDFREDVDADIAAYQEFRDAALAAEEGDFPEMMEFEEGGVFALRIDEIRPPALQPLDDVKPQVIADWEAEKAQEILVARAQEAAQAVRDGAEMAGHDLPLRSERDLLRDSFLDDAPAGMVEGIFQMAEGDLRVFLTESGAALVRLDAIRTPAPDDDQARQMKTAFVQQTAQELAADALVLYNNAVQGRTGVNVNQQAINAVHAQFQQ